MSTGSTMGNSTLSTAFRGSWFCPGGSGWRAPMSACPAFGHLSEHQCPSAAFSHCFLSRSPWARNELYRERNRSLALGGNFSQTRSKEEIITYFHSPSSLPPEETICRNDFKAGTGLVVFFCLFWFGFFNFLFFFTGIALQRAFGC